MIDGDVDAGTRCNQKRALYAAHQLEKRRLGIQRAVRIPRRQLPNARQRREEPIRVEGIVRTLNGGDRRREGIDRGVRAIHLGSDTRPRRIDAVEQRRLRHTLDDFAHARRLEPHAVHDRAFSLQRAERLRFVLRTALGGHLGIRFSAQHRVFAHVESIRRLTAEAG